MAREGQLRRQLAARVMATESPAWPFADRQKRAAARLRSGTPTPFMLLHGASKDCLARKNAVGAGHKIAG
jgi:hypothetical protein